MPFANKKVDLITFWLKNHDLSNLLLMVCSCIWSVGPLKSKSLLKFLNSCLVLSMFTSKKQGTETSSIADSFLYKLCLTYFMTVYFTWFIPKTCPNFKLRGFGGTADSCIKPRKILRMIKKTLAKWKSKTCSKALFQTNSINTLKK